MLMLCGKSKKKTHQIPNDAERIVNTTLCLINDLKKFKEK